MYKQDTTMDTSECNNEEENLFVTIEDYLDCCECIEWRSCCNNVEETSDCNNINEILM